MLSPGVRRHEPAEHAPADPDHRHVDECQTHEGPVPQNQPVPAPGPFRPRRIAHDSDEDTHIRQVGDGVGEEQRHEPGKAVGRDEAAERAADSEAGISGHPRDGGCAMPQAGSREDGHQGRLAWVERAVSRAGNGGGREGLDGRARKRQAGIASGECHPGGGGDGAGPEAVNQRARQRRGHDACAGDDADDQPGHAQAEPAAVVQVDDLERQHGAVAEHVQEDPDLDEPQLA
jgi:hypothetical protein